MPARIVAWAFLGTCLLVAFAVVFAVAIFSAYQQLQATRATPTVMAESPAAGPMFSLPSPKRQNEDAWYQPDSPLHLGDTRQHTGQERDRQMIEILAQVVESHPDMPELKVDQASGVTTIVAGDRVVATVLAEDLPDYAGRLSPKARQGLEHQLARRWLDQIQAYLFMRYIEKTPGYLSKVGLGCLLLFLAALCFHRAAGLLGHHLLDSPFWSLKALIWCLWLIGVASLIPGADIVSRALNASMAAPLLQFIGVSVAVSLATLAGNLFINRYFGALRRTQRFQSTERMELRLNTLRQTSKFLLRLSVSVLGVLVLVRLWGFQWQALLTGAGLMGVAITWIGQDIFRDFLAGFNILLENQYGVGDMIETGATLGTVEAFTLRSTKVRSADGSLSTIPNQDVKRVKNLSTGWSQVDFRVAVASQTEAQPCLSILREEVARIQADFPGVVREAPQVLGLEELGRDGVVLRALIKCSPGEQFALRRELNLRVKLRFEAAGIELPPPS